MIMANYNNKETLLKKSERRGGFKVDTFVGQLKLKIEGRFSETSVFKRIKMAFQ